MRQGYAHHAVVALGDDVDPAAVGAAVTTTLCGQLEHEPPCPLAPHHTAVSLQGPDTRVRILFATEPGREPEVRRGIEEALARGAETGMWRVEQSAAATVADSERDHVQRLVGS
jgi:hypothetical protein